MNLSAQQAYELGLKKGREEALEEVRKALGIDELIAKLLDAHLEQEHGYDR
jgi:hypothetical protein